MRAASLLIAALVAALAGCGKEYKPDPNAKGGAEHEVPEFTPPASGQSGSGLDGRWKLVKVELSETRVETPEGGKDDVVVISGNTLMKGDESGRATQFRLGPGPRDIDIFERGEDRPARGIYELRGDSLKLAVQEAPNGPRPTDFRPSGNEARDPKVTGPAASRIVVVHLTRVGPAPPASEVKKNAVQMRSVNNLKMIGVAMHNYHDANQRLPPQNGVMNPVGGKPPAPLLSWRVHLLPYLEQDALYRQFKLDQPWDSPHNLALVSLMPKVYESPNADAGPGMTHYKVFVGGGAMFDPRFHRRIADVQDGTSNTIMTIEGGEPVTWTKPDDIRYDPKGPLPNLRMPGGNAKVIVGMGDGSVRTIDLDKVSEKTLRHAIEAADGMVLGSDW